MVSSTRGRRNSGSRLKDPPEGDNPRGDEAEGSSKSSSNNNTNEEEKEESTPKFATKQRVYARDAQSLLWYEAVIRRSLFGVHHNKQVQIGLVSSESEIEEILAQTDTPTWHYFVHYNNWNTKWDRWVSEEDIMEENDESKRLTDRYQMEHKKLQKEMKKGKGRSTGDGTVFLKAWSKRMQKIEEELKNEAQGGGGGEKDDNDNNKQKGTPTTEAADPSTGGGAKKKDEQHPSTEADTTKAGPKSKKGTTKTKNNNNNNADIKWDKAAISREYNLRLRGLEGKRSSQDQHKMTLPFSLKKVMVEAWEIITQCQMVSNLPAQVTVRQGLNMYLQSKLELMKIVPTTTTANNVATAATTTAAQDEETTTTTTDPPVMKKKEGGEDDDNNSNQKDKEEQEKLQKRRQEWIDMVEGLAMFFDEALPFRLLYSQELSQYKIVENTLVLPLPAVSPEDDDDEEEEVAAFDVVVDASTTTNKKDEMEVEEEEDGRKKEAGAAPKTQQQQQQQQQQNVDSPEDPPGSMMQVDDKVKTENSNDGTKQADSNDDEDNQKVKKKVKEETVLEDQVKTECDDDDGIKAGKSNDEDDNEKKVEEKKKKIRKEKEKALSTTTATPKTRKMLPSEIYGCEHLLRLCLKIPELLAEKMPTPASDDERGLDALALYEHETKQVLAKVNDLIRFLHKNQSNMFADTYRKQNDTELKEDLKFMRSMEKRKRKRATMDAEKSSPESTTKNSNTSNNSNGAAAATTTAERANNVEAPSKKIQKVK